LVRSERQLKEQLDDNLLFRWFVGLGVDDPVWDVTVFTENRDRLLEDAIVDVAIRVPRSPGRRAELVAGPHAQTHQLGAQRADPPAHLLARSRRKQRHGQCSEYHPPQL
jgi:hypothetical protein